MINKLVSKIQKTQAPIVVGLDPMMKFIPEHITKAAFAEHGETLEGAAEAIWQYNKAIVDNIYDLIPAVKPQIAMYEQFGIPGLVAFKKTVDYCKEKGYECNTIDGVRAIFNDGWALVRYSNTGPNITARFEAKTEERLEELKKEGYIVQRLDYNRYYIKNFNYKFDFDELMESGRRTTAKILKKLKSDIDGVSEESEESRKPNDKPDKKDKPKVIRDTRTNQQPNNQSNQNQPKEKKEKPRKYQKGDTIPKI